MAYGESKGGRTRHWRLAVTLAVTLLTWAGQASAQVPCEASAIDQYVECIPTDKGSNIPGGSEETRTTLSGPAQAAVTSQGGDDAPLLTAIATSSNFGAPQRKLKIERRPGERESTAAVSGGASTGDALSAAVSAVNGGDAGRLVGLIVALALITVGALGFAALRHKRRAT
jgi:hypothetical protein